MADMYTGSAAGESIKYGLNAVADKLQGLATLGSSIRFLGVCIVRAAVVMRSEVPLVELNRWTSND